MPSRTVENYLKQIYVAELSAGGALVGMGQLAQAMRVTPGTATSMMKTLAESRLAEYEPRSGVRLTEAGRALALAVLRRHRLIELLLVNTLGLGWSEVHDEAEELEHAVSEKVLAAIDRHLGHPKFDPHGDPIPTAAGDVADSPLLRLDAMPAGSRVQIARVSDQDPAFLLFLERRGLVPGTNLTVEAADPIAEAVTLRPDGRDPLTLGSNVAAKIEVRGGGHDEQ
ncbi:MAG: metal-dependent transcriptional regulator [Phycisphaerae bacterium]